MTILVKTRVPFKLNNFYEIQSSANLIKDEIYTGFNILYLHNISNPKRDYFSRG